MAYEIELADNDCTRSETISMFVSRAHRALQICDLLEALADDLPRRQAPIWREAQVQCRAVLYPHFGFLAERLLPFLLERVEGNEERQELLARLQADGQDQLHALSELDDLMTDVVDTNALYLEPESLGFGLRCFFDAIRSKLNWEIDVIWPLVARILSREETAKMRASLDTGHALS